MTGSATFAFGTKYVVNTPPVTFNLAAGKTIGVTLPFVVLKNTPKGRTRSRCGPRIPLDL